MIWSDPWIEVATTPSIYRPLCTRIPPPSFALPDSVVCRAYNMNDSANAPLLSKWNTLIQSTWTHTQLQARLQHAWIMCLHAKDTHTILATCVLRPRTHEGVPFCILETLTVAQSQRRKGYGALLMRCTLKWLWETYGPCILGYMWELTPAAFVKAWWRGWLRSVAEIRLGWMWSSPHNHVPKENPLPLRFHTKEGERFVVITDSGLGDGWGYVQDCSGEIDWAAIAFRGGWKSLWSHVAPASKEWKWSGEIVVVGLLNYCGKTLPSFRSAEITHCHQRTYDDDSHARGYGRRSPSE